MTDTERCTNLLFKFLSFYFVLGECHLPVWIQLVSCEVEISIRHQERNHLAGGSVSGEHFLPRLNIDQFNWTISILLLSTMMLFRIVTRPIRETISTTLLSATRSWKNMPQPSNTFEHFYKLSQEIDKLRSFSQYWSYTYFFKWKPSPKD